MLYISQVWVWVYAIPCHQPEAASLSTPWLRVSGYTDSCVYPSIQCSTDLDPFRHICGCASSRFHLGWHSKLLKPLGYASLMIICSGTGKSQPQGVRVSLSWPRAYPKTPAESNGTDSKQDCAARVMELTWLLVLDWWHRAGCTQVCNTATSSSFLWWWEGNRNSKPWLSYVVLTCHSVDENWLLFACVKVPPWVLYTFKSVTQMLTYYN